jgi:hypothetical protein
MPGWSMRKKEQRLVKQGQAHRLLAPPAPSTTIVAALVGPHHLAWEAQLWLEAVRMDCLAF